MINILFSFNKFLDATWKVVLALIFVLIAFFALFGLIGRAIEMIINHQGKKIDKFMSPIVIAGLIDDEKDFVKIAKHKSKRYFFLTSIAPISLMLVGVLIFVIYHGIVGNWGESIFNDQTGIGTLFWTWDYSNATYYPPLGFDGIVLRNTPHFLTNASMTNYFVFLFSFTGLIWYLINVQAYIARHLRIKKLQDTMFSKDLGTIDLAKFYNVDGSNNELNNTNQNNQEKSQ